MKGNTRITLATIATLAGLATSASADFFSFNTDFGTPWTTTINGVVVRYTPGDQAARVTVLGDLRLLDGDTLRFVGSKPAQVYVLNNLIIEPGAIVDAAAHTNLPGPGGGSGGASAPQTEPGSFGGLGGLGGAFGAGGVGGVLGSGGSSGFPGVTGVIGTRGGPRGAQDSVGSPGEDAMNAPGSGGAAGVTVVGVDLDGASGGDRGIGVSGGSGGSAGGGNGHNGRAGNDGGNGEFGSVGEAGGPGQPGEHLGAQFDLIGGGGGGGGAAGTSGGGGGGGGGGSGGSGGGGGGSAGVLSTGGAGGGGTTGGTGGRGGRGGRGGAGSYGGGGGGAVEFRVFGWADLGGLLDASGGSSAFPDMPDAEEGEAGSAASNNTGGGFNGLGGGGHGGAGGRGGTGGRGGHGGYGGQGGKGGFGAGGCFVLRASVFEVTTTGWIDVTDGYPFLGPGDARSPGRVAIGDNIEGAFLPADVPGQGVSIVFSNSSQLAITEFSPYGFSSAPTIPDLVDGAEVYGLAPLTASDFQGVVDAAPNGADLAMVRLDLGPAPFDQDFIGRDLIAVINFGDRTIDDVAIAIDSRGDTLLTRGTTARAADMPGAPLDGLAPGAVWITTSGEGTHSFELAAGDLSVAGPLDPGGALYLSTLCAADFNGDGSANFFDVSAFLAAFIALDPAADLNDDGQYNFFDVSAFLSAFTAGCP